MKLKTPFLKYVYRNIGIITFLLFITFCFYCISILASSRPNTVITAISDFSIYDETKWIFVAISTGTAFGILFLFKEILITLSLGKNLFLNIIGIILCISFIGLSLTPYTHFELPHTIFILLLLVGFGIFLFLIALFKKFRGKYIIFTALIGIVELLFVFMIFPYLVKISAGWLLPEIIVLTIMGLWIFVTEMFLSERANKIRD